MQRVTKYLWIQGRVQGVGFRFYMERKARALDITGWVRNRTDGSVEAMVQGSAEAVEAIIAVAQRGPPSAKVTGVRITDADGQFAAFDLLPTE